MTREEQDQALAAMGFESRGFASHGWRRQRVSGWDLYVSLNRIKRRYQADMYSRYDRQGVVGRAPETVFFDDPVSAASYLLIQAADQP